MIAWPSECDDALISLRVARDELGSAVDELRNNLQVSRECWEPFDKARDAVSWAIEHVADVMVTHAQVAVDTEAVEVRHIDAQIFEWMENDP